MGWALLLPLVYRQEMDPEGLSNWPRVLVWQSEGFGKEGRREGREGGELGLAGEDLQPKRPLGGCCSGGQATSAHSHLPSPQHQAPPPCSTPPCLPTPPLPDHLDKLSVGHPSAGAPPPAPGSVVGVMLRLGGQSDSPGLLWVACVLETPRLGFKSWICSHI